MKSYNHLYEQFISDENIKLAIHNACKHKAKRKGFKELKENPDANIEWIRKYAENFKNDKHEPKIIYDGIQRKKRTIIVPTFREQIVHHMVVNILKPIIMKSMYEHSYGSVPKRGGTMGKKCIEKWLKDTKNTKYCLKMDIRKYFDTIPHTIIIMRLEAIIHDERFMNVLKEIINVNNVGIPIGFYTSQWLANWYLTIIDHFIKEDLRATYYIRYMDDMIVFGASKRKLHKIRVKVNDALHAIGLSLKDNWQIFPLDRRSLDFMGFRFFRYKTTLRKSILRKMRRKANRIHNKDKPTIYDCKQMISYLGWIQQTDMYGYYEQYIKNKISFQTLKRRVSNYDKRMAKCAG